MSPSHDLSIAAVLALASLELPLMMRLCVCATLTVSVVSICFGRRDPHIQPRDGGEALTLQPMLSTFENSFLKPETLVPQSYTPKPDSEAEEAALRN